MNINDFTAFSLSMVGKKAECFKTFYCIAPEGVPNPESFKSVLFNVGDEVLFTAFTAGIDEQAVLIKDSSDHYEYYPFSDYSAHFKQALPS